MNFDNFVIDKEDYLFFSELSDEAKILFLYDLICEGYYGNGSIYEEVPEGEVNTKLLVDQVKGNLDLTADANVIIVHDTLIITSDDINQINSLLVDMITEGLIVGKCKLTNKAVEIFCHQKYYKAFEIIKKN